MALSRSSNSRLAWPGALLGFGLGGFFDGILLHQILQWHHLLSLVPGAGDLAMQIFYDGMFHVLMYVIVVVGLVMLARRRTALTEAGAGRHLVGAVLIGFGLWHFVDIGFFHWVLGLHRVRIDTPDPLFWDLAWLGAFGIPAVVAGYLLLKGRSSGNGPDGRRAALGVVLAVAIAGPWAAAGPADAKSAIIVFKPGTTQGQAINAIAEADGALLWHKRGVWAVRWQNRARPLDLYSGGALLVSSGWVAAGCLGWTRP